MGISKSYMVLPHPEENKYNLIDKKKVKTTKNTLLELESKNKSK